MPYFMDFHIFDGVTVEEVKQAHMADRSVQDRYGVKYVQFWVNANMGTVFCLMEGPNAEACARVHREAHGNTACNISEVEKGLFEQFMGEKPLLDHGLVLKQNGKLDTGFRFLMMVDLINLTDTPHIGQYKKLLQPSRPKTIVSNSIEEYKGKEIRNEWDDGVLAVFETKDALLQSAFEIKQLLNPLNGIVRFKIALNLGQPISENKGFFEESILHSRRLNVLGEDGEIVIDSSIPFSKINQQGINDLDAVRILTKGQTSFIKSFFNLMEERLNDSTFSVNMMTEELGVSRPQLYRKIMELTGRSPNQFLRDVRLRKALSLIRENKYNISEVAYEVGFGNPSYFSKRFQEKYGTSPSKIAG